MPTRRWGDDDADKDTGSNNNSNTNDGGHGKSGAASSSSSQTVETEPDANGIKTVVTLTTDERGRRTKIVKKVQVRQVEALVPKAVLKRRNMRKFGACENLPPGIEPGITSLGDEVMIIAKTKQATPVEAKKDEVFTMNIVCRTCGKEGDHWTSKCPYKGRLQDLPDAPRQEEAETPTRALRSGGGYVPPAMRAGGSRAGESERSERSYRDHDDANTIRVSNLSEEATQADVEDLFMPFGRTTRIFLARDKKTNLSRGFAFISYLRREDAQRAIDKMNGQGYDHLILKVEFSEKK